MRIRKFGGTRYTAVLLTLCDTSPTSVTKRSRNKSSKDPLHKSKQSHQQHVSEIGVGSVGARSVAGFAGQLLEEAEAGEGVHSSQAKLKVTANSMAL